MKRVYRIEGLDCANCAAKIEKKVAALEGVLDVSVNFLTTKMVLDLKEDNLDETILEIEKAVKKIEPDSTLKRA